MSNIKSSDYVEKKVNDLEKNTKTIQNDLTSIKTDVEQIKNDGVTTETVTNTVETKVNQMLADGSLAAMTIEDNSISGSKYKDNSITPDKTSFLEKEQVKNLFNCNSVDNRDGVKLGSNGSNGSDSGLLLSYLIPVEAGKYTLSYSTGAHYLAIRTYSDEGTTQVRALAYQNYSANSIVITISEEEKYMQFNCTIADKNEVQLEKGETKTAFEVYKAPKYTLKDGVFEKYVEAKNIKDVIMNEFPNEHKMTKNLFNENECIQDKYLDSYGGLYPTKDWKASGFIEVKPNTSYVISRNYETVFTGIEANNINNSYCYDENKQMIQKLGGNPFTTPANCKYIRLSIKGELKNFMVEEGDQMGYYIPYGYEKDYKSILESPFLGKKYCPIGDSITATGWGRELARQLGMVIFSYNAIGGTTLCKNTLNAETGNSTWMYSDARINAIPTDTEIITLMCGANDWSQQSYKDTWDTTTGKLTVGNVNDLALGDTTPPAKNTLTFAYGLQYMLNRIYERCPNARVFLLENTYRYLENTDRETPLEAWRDMVRQIGYKNGYPVLKTYANAGINEMNYTTYLSDIIHPNAAGQKRIVEVVKSGMLSIVR